MNKAQEALKMVNNILEDEMWFPNKYPDQAIPVCFIETIKACKEALAELEQQPKVTGFIRTLETVDKDGIETWKLEPFFTLQSLQEHDNEVIEMCAKVCDELGSGQGWTAIASMKIRRLKGNQNEQTT